MFENKKIILKIVKKKNSLTTVLEYDLFYFYTVVYRLRIPGRKLISFVNSHRKECLTKEDRMRHIIKWYVKHDILLMNEFTIGYICYKETFLN